MPPKTPIAEFPCIQCGRVRKQWTTTQIPAPVCHWCATEARKAEALQNVPARFFAMTREGAVPPHRPELGACLLFTGSVNKETLYGRFNMGRELGVKGAHVVAFYLADGRWPQPYACHHCDNRICVRRSHLFEGSAAENNADMDQKGRRVVGGSIALNAAKTHCPKDHPYSGTDSRGSRICSTCANERRRARRAAGLKD